MTPVELRTARAGLGVSVALGSQALEEEALRLAELATTTSVSATCRWAWQSASLRSRKGARPWAVLISEGPELVAAAVLVDEEVDGRRLTRLLGTNDGHRGALLARTGEAGRALGAALATALTAQACAFQLGPLEAGDALGALLQFLPAEVVLEPVAVPILMLGQEPEAELGKAMRRTLRKARNRLATDGVTVEVDVLHHGADIAAVLPLILTLSRDRDHACQRDSPLDDPMRRRLWQDRLLALADEGVLRLATLRLDGEVAAYVLAVVESPFLRVLDGRYVERFRRYAPGRLLEADVVEQVRRSPDLHCIDWMTTVSPESLLASNASDQLVIVHGSS